MTGKSKTIVITAMLVVGASSLCMFFAWNPKLIIVIGVVAIVLEVALINPPSRHRIFNIKDVSNYKGSFCNPQGIYEDAPAEENKQKRRRRIQ